MYSKEEALQIKKNFWIQFAETHPRKWLLYNTKIKDFSFKFYVDNKKAEVSLDIENKDLEKRKIYFEKIISLQNILIEDFLSEIQIDDQYRLENGKQIARFWVVQEGVSVNNPKTWPTIFDFFYEKMDAFERFFYEYEDYIRDLEINT